MGSRLDVNPFLLSATLRTGPRDSRKEMELSLPLILPLFLLLPF
jgi:hypothetical protein